MSSSENLKRKKVVLNGGLIIGEIESVLINIAGRKMTHLKLVKQMKWQDCSTKKLPHSELAKLELPAKPVLRNPVCPSPSRMLTKSATLSQ